MYTKMNSMDSRFSHAQYYCLVCGNPFFESRSRELNFKLDNKTVSIKIPDLCSDKCVRDWVEVMESIANDKDTEIIVTKITNCSK